jgi:hypothetical protein
MALGKEASINRQCFKISYGNRRENISYYSGRTAADDLIRAIRMAFEIAPSQNFRLRTEDDTIFAITPVDFTIDEIFRLEVLPETNPGI